MESRSGNRIAARVACSIGSIVDLGQCPFRAGKPALERLADPDLGQATHGLDRTVADSLAEPLRGAELGALREGRDACPGAIATRLEVSADRLEVPIIG